MSLLEGVVVMALAAYRLWRIVGEDTWPPTLAFRAWLEVRVESHRDHAERWVEADPELSDRFARRMRRTEIAYELITCPWCLGSWVAGAVVLAVDVAVGLPLPLLQWGAVACLVGIIGKVDG